MELIVLLMRLILLIMKLPLLIAKPASAFMADTSMVVPYAQCVAKGFVLLITTVHGFRYVQVYVYIKTSIHCRGHVPYLDIVRNHVVTAVTFCCALCLRSDNQITLTLTEPKNDCKMFNRPCCLLQFLQYHSFFFFSSIFINLSLSRVQRLNY